MTDVDTSFYPTKASSLPVSPLDVAQKFGALRQQQQQIQSGALQINQQQLDQANQGLTYLARAMSSLGPNATKDQYKAAGDQVTRQLGLPPEKTAIWNEQVDAAPDGPTFFKRAMSQIGDHQQILNLQTGVNSTANDNANVYQGKTDPMTGGFAPSTRMAVQPPPTQPNVNNQPTVNGQPNPSYMQPGIVGASAPAGVSPVPQQRPSLPVTRPAPAVPGPITSPAIQGPSANFGGNVVAANVGPPTNAATGAPIQSAPSPVVTGPPPGFEEGMKQRTEDQANATQKMTAVKPAILAMKLLPGLRSGPGTEPFQKAVAFLKANNLISTEQQNDPTVVYQEANKYLSQYLKGRGGRSDADLEAAAKSSPNVGTQLNPALQNLTRSAVAQDRIEAARPTAFEGSDYSKYGQHRATFPQSVDERAFQLDLMPPAQSKKLVDQMHDLAFKNGKNADGSPKKPPAEAIKFFHSLDIAKKQGFFNAGEE